MSHRFYIDESLSPGEIQLTGDEAHHLVNVMRYQSGDRIELFNGDGFAYPGEILEASKRNVVVRVLSQVNSNRELPFRLWIATALPKGDRFDFLLEKLTELGVTDLIPLQTTHSVVLPKSDKAMKWHRAVIEASKQCGRNRLMQIHPPSRFSELLARNDLPVQRYLADPTGVVWDRSLLQGDRIFALGPEGGFTEDEIAASREQSWQIIRLGPRILRIETAALMVAAVSTG